MGATRTGRLQLTIAALVLAACATCTLVSFAPVVHFPAKLQDSDCTSSHLLLDGRSSKAAPTYDQFCRPRLVTHRPMIQPKNFPDVNDLVYCQAHGACIQSSMRWLSSCATETCEGHYQDPVVSSDADVSIIEIAPALACQVRSLLLNCLNERARTTGSHFFTFDWDLACDKAHTCPSDQNGSCSPLNEVRVLMVRK